MVVGWTGNGDTRLSLTGDVTDEGERNEKDNNNNRGSQTVPYLEMQMALLEEIPS